MKYYRFIILLFLVAPTVGCQDQQEQQRCIIDISPVDTLVGALFHRGVDDMLISNDFKVTDSCVLTINLSGNYVFNYYSTSGSGNTNTFGSKGNGRNEFIFPIFVNDYRSTDHRLTVFDANKGGLFNIAPNASDAIIDIDQRISKLINSFNINIINEYMIIGNKADVSEGLFYIYNKENKDYDWVEYCCEDVKYRDISKYELYYNTLTYNHRTNEVVAALRYFNKILFYSIDKRSFKEIQIGDIKRQPRFDSSKQDVSLEESEIVFIDICVSDEYIYCLMLDHNQMPILIKLNIYGEFINCAYLDRPIFRIEIYNDEFVYGIGDDGTGLADIVKYNLLGF